MSDEMLAEFFAEDRHESAAEASRSVVAVIRGRADDTGVLLRACALARAHTARLTVMHVWSPSPWMHWAALAGVHPGNLLTETEREASRRLHELSATLPLDLPCTLVCHRGRAAEGVIQEVSARCHDCLVLGPNALSRRLRARLRRLHPDLRIVIAHADSLQSSRLRRSSREAAYVA